MSAHDTLEWYLAAVMKDRSGQNQQYIRSLREHFFALRSEDERQRFVDQMIEELHSRDTSKQRPHRA